MKKSENKRCVEVSLSTASHRDRRRADRADADYLARNVGGRTDGDPGAAGTPSVNGDSVRSGDADIAINAGTNTDQRGIDGLV